MDREEPNISPVMDLRPDTDMPDLAHGMYDDSRGAEPAPIGVLIMSEAGAVRTVLANMVRASRDTELLGGVCNAEAAALVWDATTPRVVVIDLEMRSWDAVGEIEALRRANPTVGIVAVASDGSPERLDEVRRAGVDAFVVNDGNPRRLGQAIVLAANGLPHRSRLSRVRAPGSRRTA